MIDTLTPPSDLNLLAKYPHLYPPQGFCPLDRNGFISLQNLTAAPASTVLETIKEVGPGMEGWIRLLGLESGNFQNSWLSIYEDGQPMKNYVVLQAPIGSTSTPRAAFVKLVGGKTYELRASIKANQVPFIAFRWTLFGWYYPIPR